MKSGRAQFYWQQPISDWARAVCTRKYSNTQTNTNTKITLGSMWYYILCRMYPPAKAGFLGMGRSRHLSKQPAAAPVDSAKKQCTVLRSWVSSPQAAAVEVESTPALVGVFDTVQCKAYCVLCTLYSVHALYFSFGGGLDVQFIIRAASPY